MASFELINPEVEAGLVRSSTEECHIGCCYLFCRGKCRQIQGVQGARSLRNNEDGCIGEELCAATTDFVGKAVYSRETVCSLIGKCPVRMQRDFAM